MGARKVEDLDVWQLCKSSAPCWWQELRALQRPRISSSAIRYLAPPRMPSPTSAKALVAFAPVSSRSFSATRSPPSLKCFNAPALLIAASTSTTTLPPGWSCSAFALIGRCAHFESIFGPFPKTTSRITQGPNHTAPAINAGTSANSTRALAECPGNRPSPLKSLCTCRREPSGAGDGRSESPERSP